MNRQELTVELQKLLSILKAEVALETAASFADIKTALAEVILLEPLRAMFGLPGLISLNAAKKRNFPAVDVADESSRTGIQLTATPELSKIKQTIDTFRNHKLFDRFDRLHIVLLADKRKYRSNLSQLSEGLFDFSEENVFDLGDLFKRISSLEDLPTVRRVVQGLRANLVGTSLLDGIRDRSTQTDILHVNLLPIRVPDVLYMARLTLDRKAIKDGHQGRRKLRYDRDYALAALAQADHRFERDFCCHDGALLTFRPIEEHRLEKLGLIDEGTIEPIDPKSYFSASLDTEIQFRYLLRLSLQYALREHSVFWQHEEGMFAFGPREGEEARAEDWIGQKRSTRVVYKLLLSKNENARPVHKHFGFRVQFKCVDRTWYLVVEPKWLFSWDGYAKSFAHARLATLTAQRERNAQIYQHTRFISWFLTTKLEERSHRVRFYKNIVVVGESAFTDKDWVYADGTV